METSWFMLHIRPEAKEAPEGEQPQKMDAESAEADKAEDHVARERALSFRLPQVGTPVVHYLGAIDDEAAKKRDKENPLWDKFQDGVRPTWAPDFLRLGYAIVFRRDGLPKLAVKLGLKNPANIDRKKRSRKRVLTFDDVWAVGVVPHAMPMYFPDKDLKPEDWWLSIKDRGSLTSPYLAPGGATVATGAQRLSDLVIQHLRQPAAFPRPIPSLQGDDDDDYSEFINPLVPLKPRVPTTGPSPGETAYRPSYDTSTGYGWAGLELFRWR